LHLKFKGHALHHSFMAQNPIQTQSKSISQAKIEQIYGQSMCFCAWEGAASPIIIIRLGRAFPPKDQ
jgi:hypothetical protein